MVGAAPIEYLARLRMQLAAERLRTSRQSLGQVAEAVGYESEAAFSRAFRRIVGVSPGAWREAAV
jgi:AraC-like DNA-binding protein